MPKMRFELQCIKRSPFNIVKYDILMRNIIEVTINNKKYFKKNYTNSIDIMNFYRFILNNAKNVTEIETSKDELYYLKNCKLHCEEHSAWTNNHIALFFINGKWIDYKNWLLYQRKNKIIKLINII